MTVHLKKLAVGAESLAHFEERVAGRITERKKKGERPLLHVFTRSTPKRAEEILKGGSLYWVIKGAFRARMPVVAIEQGENARGEPRCVILLDPDMVRTAQKSQRPFQGWRYLETDDAPRDITGVEAEGDELPEHMEKELRDLGLL